MQTGIGHQARFFLVDKANCTLLAVGIMFGLTLFSRSPVVRNCAKLLNARANADSRRCYSRFPDARLGFFSTIIANR
jgi:hypothetical protein